MWFWLMAAAWLGQTPAPSPAVRAANPAELEREVDRLFSQSSAPTLGCAAVKYPARLGYDFRYWTGIDFELSLAQFTPVQPGGRLWLLLRVTPDGRPARYFTQVRFLPGPKNLPANANPRKIQLNLSGGVYVGEGRYKLEAMLIDERERRCRKEWTVDAKALGTPLRIEPYTVESGRGRARPAAAGEPKERVAAVLTLDSLSPRWNAARLNGWERAALTGSLFSLIDSRPEAEFSLDVIHVEGRRVLYSTPRFTAASVEPLMRALRDLDLATVDFGALKKGAKGEFFAGFIEKKRDEWQEREAVVFIGPAWRWGEKLPEALKRKQEGGPKLAYLAFGPPMLNPEDVAKQFVTAQEGRILKVSTPQDLARALRKLWQDTFTSLSNASLQAR